MRKIECIFSIIICSNNSAKTIGSTLESIAIQSFRDYEVIVIDNNSSDNTLSIINEFKDRIEKIRIISEADTGIYNAINKGILNSKGKVIAILHSDNYFSSKSILEIVYEELKFDNDIVTYGNILIVDSGNRIKRVWKSSTFNIRKLYLGWTPPHPSLFVSSKIYSSIGGYREDLRISSDYDFILKLFKNRSLKFKHIDVAMINMLSGGVSNSGVKNHLKKWQEDLKVLRDHNMPTYITLLLKIIRKIPQYKLFNKK